MKSKAIVFLTITIFLLVAFTAGCGLNSQDATTDEPTTFMAWQFAQGLVRERVPNPSNATYPRFDSSFIERKDNNVFVIDSHVNTADSKGNIITYSFMVEAEYLGNDVFEEKSVELRKN